MPIATNPDTGDVVYLDDTGGWKPAKTAVNPQTREMMAFDGRGWQKVTTQGHGIVGYIDDAVRSIASGMTFGYADKLAAKMDELTGRGGTYEQNIKKERAKTEAIPSAIKIPGEIAGGVTAAIASTPFTAPAAAVTGLSKLPGLARAMLGGAGAGALYGAGNTDTGAVDTAVSAATGAGIGAVAGGVLSSAGRVVSHLRNPAGRAEIEINRALQRDNMTPQSAASALKSAPGEATLADVGGENVKGLVERVAQTQGAGRTEVVPYLTERQSQQANRIADDLKSLTGSKRTAFQATTQTIAERSKDATPLYQKAYADGEKVIWSPELERLSSAPAVQRAMKSAVSEWQDHVVADGYGSVNPGAMSDSSGILKMLNGKVPVFPNLQFWDYTKRALARSASMAFSAGDTTTSRALGKIERALRSELDTAVPSYATARASWSGPSAYLDALETGKNILSRKITAEEFAASLRSAGSESERQGIREGAVSAIIAQLESDPAKMADMTKYLRSTAMRGKVAAIMPTPRLAQEWNRRLGFEVGSSELTGRALGNSATARRLAEQQDASIIGDLVLDAMQGHPTSIVTKLLKNTVGKARDTIRSKTDAEIAKRLLRPSIGGPSALQP
jgi:hypothetical protein